MDLKGSEEMKRKSFYEVMIELYNYTVFGKQMSFQDIYIKDGDDNFHKVQEADLMDSRFRCEDGYFDEYEWIKEDDTRIYVK